MVPSALPQTPFTGGGKEAEQLAVVPPLLPVQDQAKGPVPVTEGVVPVAVQRFDVGAEVTVAPFALPQTPFTGVRRREAEQLAVAPP